MLLNVIQKQDDFSLSLVNFVTKLKHKTHVSLNTWIQCISNHCQWLLWNMFHLDFTRCSRLIRKFSAGMWFLLRIVQKLSKENIHKQHKNESSFIFGMKVKALKKRKKGWAERATRNISICLWSQNKSLKVQTI